MMFRGLMRLGASHREPVVDNHPLARPDGGWYPGKRFDPTDILTDPGNWIVWKQFLIFFFSVLIIPVAVFVVTEWMLRRWAGLHFQQSQTIGALISVICLQGLMYYYARLAVWEDKADRLAEGNAATAVKADGDVLQTESKKVDDISEAVAKVIAAGAETTAVQRHDKAGEEISEAVPKVIAAGAETTAVQKHEEAEREKQPSEAESTEGKKDA